MGRGRAPEHLNLCIACALTTAWQCQPGPGFVCPPTTSSYLPGSGSISRSPSGWCPHQTVPSTAVISPFSIYLSKHPQPHRHTTGTARLLGKIPSQEGQDRRHCAPDVNFTCVLVTEGLSWMGPRSPKSSEQ